MKFSLLSIAAAFFCSTMLGVLPPRNDSRLDPIEALARE
jgi:ABC-type antimicrobial peptide transport system permease subunit